MPKKRNDNSIPIGIDFGTSNSAIAYAVPDRAGELEPRTIIWGGVYPQIPTAVYIPLDSDPIVGHGALTWGADDWTRIFLVLKPISPRRSMNISWKMVHL